MKKRFLPFSLLLVIMILGQSVIADQGGHYVPRKQTSNAESFMGSLRANQKTGLIDPADMFKAMQTPAAKSAADDPLYWINMGPDNMGGQTTAILYDNRKENGHTNGIVYIGSKGGGVYKTYNHGVTWHQVGGLDLMVSCMAQDENGVIYVGTGDCGDAAAHNGLSQQGYDNSFVGTGLYTLIDDVFEQVLAPTEDAWLFINELAIAGNKVLAATNEGLMYSRDGGRTWSTAIEGKAVSVKVGSDNTIVAAVDGHVFIGNNVTELVDHSGTSSNLQGDSLLPQGVSGGMVDIAIAPSNANVIYASFIKADGNHSGVFVSNNKGQTWRTALPSVSSGYGHNVYEGWGLYNHGLVVDPENADLVYVLGYNLWSLTANAGYFIANQLTNQSYYYLPDYIHVGLHTMVFNPNNSQECYVGTDGGIYKATGRFTFSYCNRNYTTARMFNVAYSGKDTRVLAAGLDHGTVYIPGDANGSTPGAGYWINPRGDNMGMFSEGSSAGSCAFSMLNANTIFVSYLRQDDSDHKRTWFARSETLGEDWVSSNFTSAMSSYPTSNSSFRIPLLLSENYNNQQNPETAWYFNESGHHQDAGTTVQVMSNNGYPFNYTLTSYLAAGDSIEVHDPITSYFYVAATDVFLMTRTPLQFDKEAVWYKLADKNATGGNFKGDPLCMDISADGNTIFVGFKDGKLFRISGLNSVVDSHTGTIGDSLYAVTVTKLTLPISGQCVTSVAVDPRDDNKVIATCGNYGNEDYVFYSTDAMSDEPTFVSKQGNLPKMPVYSSVIDMTTGDVIIGTERGIYRSKNLSSWTFDSEALGEIPVMELKQQRLFVEDVTTVNHTDEGDFITEYPGVKNTGIIYAATYGRGVFRCENYKKEFASVPETPSVEGNINVNIYPNPVSSQAIVSFDLSESCDVNYQVFDMTGRMLMNQTLGRMNQGNHQININAENLSNGSYILRISQGAKNETVKFMVY